MKKTNSILAIATLLLLPLILFAGEKPNVQLAGVRIVGPGHGLNGSELRAFNQQSGTSIALLVKAPENKNIIEVERSKCSLSEFTDNLGHDLLNSVHWDAFPDISEDGNLALVEVESKNRPSQGASQLLAKGTIRLRMAASSVTEKIENIKLEVGAEANVQNSTVKVVKVEQANERLEVVLEMSRHFMDNMKDIRFYTVENTPVEIWGRGSFTFGNVSQMDYTLDTDSVPKALVIEMDLWQELETINLPFEIESGMGF